MVGLLIAAGSVAYAQTLKETQTMHPWATDLPDDSPSVEGTGDWKRYENTDNPFPFTFDYPERWRVSLEEGKEQPYWQWIARGPRHFESQYHAHLLIRRAPTKSDGGLYEDLQALIAARQRQAGAGNEFEVLEEGTVSIGGLNAVRIDFTQGAMLPADRSGTKKTMLQTASAYFVYRGDLYEIIYGADSRDYSTYQHVFERFLSGLELNPPSL